MSRLSVSGLHLASRAPMSEFADTFQLLVVDFDVSAEPQSNIILGFAGCGWGGSGAAMCASRRRLVNSR